MCIALCRGRGHYLPHHLVKEKQSGFCLQGKGRQPGEERVRAKGSE